MNGVFCFTASADVFNPVKLIKFLNSFADFEIMFEKSNLKLQSGQFVCVCIYQTCSFRLNYDYLDDEEAYNISLNRYSGSGYTAAKVMKSLRDKLKKELGL